MDLEHPEVRPKPPPEQKSRVFDHFAGTPQYMPPECIHNKGSFLTSDIWSLGIQT
jgi:serine/threonine protein kinase